VSYSTQAARRWRPTIGIQKKVLGLICASVLVSILSAGLWPFHAPKNEVSWLSDGNGLHVGTYGVMLTPNPLGFAGLRDAISCSVEIWLQPAIVDVGGTILAFYAPEARTVGFSLHQSIDNLLLRRGTYQGRGKAELYAVHLFRKSKQLFITITSSPQGTEVYLNGALVRTSPQFRLSTQDLTGQIVVGNNPLVDDGWQGQLRGLAIYDRELNAAEVLQHYDDWTTNQKAEIKNEGPVALYLFNERTGSIVRNQMNSETDLHIPEHFLLLHAPFLKRPWSEFEPGWGYWKNVLINIAGFIPLGFFFCAYFSSVRRLGRPILATIVLGGLVSFTIEALQAFLPTRDSGMTDIITNTLGTGIGAMLYGCESVQAVFATLGLGGVHQPVSRDRFTSPSGYVQ
jgi:hypothetical protein